MRFVVEKEGKTAGTLRAETYIGETEDFKVMQGDLDGDKKRELIIANRASTSAGLAVTVWSIMIFPDTDFRSFPLPLSFSVKEFGAHGTFVFLAIQRQAEFIRRVIFRRTLKSG